MIKRKDEKNPNRFSRWFGHHESVFVGIIIAIAILSCIIYFLYKNAKNMERRLQSCESSCSIVN